MATVHTVTAWIAVITTGLTGLWATAAAFVHGARHRSLWWSIGAAQLIMMIQVVFGVIHMTTSNVEPPDSHVFYGFLTFIAIGIIYSYRHQMEHQIHLLYGLGTLFVMGLGIRAMVLG